MVGIALQSERMDQDPLLKKNPDHGPCVEQAAVVS
jgi:hypothetical protein